MADTFILPKFREKVIYWTLPNSSTEVSYPVSASYKGILRLSPNDDGTLVERNTIQVYEGGTEIAYRDTIDPQITQQFIRVSSSDGYFVGLRFNQYDVEGDDVYTIGPGQFNQVRLYTRKNNALKIKAVTSLPCETNQNTSAPIGSAENIDIDISGVDTHNANDQSYIAVSRNITERQFTFEQTTQLIRDLVVEALLDLHTIPVGSIQYMPVNIHEYETLLLKGKPNHFFQDDGVTLNDPLIRDFLLCDGSLYKNEDFPELAKVLEGERVDYWRFDSAGNKMVQATYINDYSEKKQFRVPDLRARYLKSLLLGRDEIGGSNVTGSYTVDSLPLTTDNKGEIHQHFIASAIYGDYVNDSYAEAVTTDPTTGDLALGTAPGVMAPANGEMYFTAGQYGAWYNPSRYTWNCASYRVPTNPAGYFLSIPQEYNWEKKNITATVGITSVDVASCETTPASDDIIDYNGRTDYVPYVGSGAANSYGMEITPETFCALPLIKI